MPGSVLITGASSGLGLETAVYLASRGWRVFATVRDPARKAEVERAAVDSGARLEVLPLDVTNRASIQEVVQEVVSRAGGIDALVNNAGIQVRGYFEDVCEEEIRRVFETNLFGTMALTRAVLPHMRQARRGRILLVSSIGGRLGSLALSAYCASKFALEGFGESLAMEIAPLGIHVTLIEPGMIRTDIWGKNRGVSPGALDPASPYAAWFQASERLANAAVSSSPTTPLHVARVVARALASPRPRLRYVVGRRAEWLLALRHLMPGHLFEKMYFSVVLKKVTLPRISGD